MTIDLLEGGVQTLYSQSNDTSECCDKGLNVTDLPLIRVLNKNVFAQCIDLMSPDWGVWSL